MFLIRATHSKKLRLNTTSGPRWMALQTRYGRSQSDKQSASPQTENFQLRNFPMGAFQHCFGMTEIPTYLVSLMAMARIFIIHNNMENEKKYPLELHNMSAF